MNRIILRLAGIFTVLLFSFHVHATNENTAPDTINVSEQREYVEVCWNTEATSKTQGNTICKQYQAVADQCDAPSNQASEHKSDSVLLCKENTRRKLALITPLRKNRPAS